jgi:trigger factor
LKVETEDLENRQVRLKVEVPEDRLQAAMRAAARRMSKSTRIPGFRPGKAPYEVLLNRFGEEAIFDEALDSLGQEVYRQALDEAAVEPFAPGSLDEVVSRQPLMLQYTVPLAPQVDLAGYRDIRQPYDRPPVSDEAVEAFLDELRQSQALIEPVDRPLQAGDVAVVNLVGEMVPPEGGQAETLINQESASILVSEENDWPVPRVAAHLTGMNVGQETNFEYTFPEEYATESLRGRTARFHLRVSEVKSRTVPDWTDDLARSLGEYADLDDLRKQVRQALEDQSRRRYDEEHAEKALEAMVRGAAVRYPPQVLKEEIDDILHDMDQRLKLQGLSLDTYLKSESKTLQEMETELEPRARRQLERALVLYEIIEAEKLEVADDELSSTIDRLAGSQGGASESMRKNLERPENRRRLAFNLLTEKALERASLIARGDAAPLQQEKAAEAKETEQTTEEMRPE